MKEARVNEMKWIEVEMTNEIEWRLFALRPGVAAHEGSAGNCKKGDGLVIKWTHEVQLYLFYTKKSKL